MEHKQGICPKCGSDGLTYGNTKKQDIAIGYLYVCESCRFEGIEWYNLHFTEHTDPGCNKVPKAEEKPCENLPMLSDPIKPSSTEMMKNVRAKQEIKFYHETVPCELCGRDTRMLGTKRCDGCWELETRIDGDVSMTLKILKRNHNMEIVEVKRTKVIIFVAGGVMNSVSATDPNISVTLADKDNVETKEDEAAYNLLVALSEGDGYTEIY